jgi:signal transduction histidine kinase
LTAKKTRSKGLNNFMIYSIRDWLDLYHPMILFVYGLAFFIIGMATFFQSRRHYRGELITSLRWLAVFGLMHAFFEWGDLFIPIQKFFHPESAINILRAIQLILLAASFGCMFMFAGKLLQPVLKLWHILRLLPPIIFTLWLIGPFGFGLIITEDLNRWQTMANILARYFLGFPGALFSAYALWRYGRNYIAPLTISNKTQTLRVLLISCLSLTMYGLSSGLVGPRASFFPATIINTETVTRLFVFPPPVFRTLSAVIFTVSITRALEVLGLETNRIITDMQKSEAVMLERARTARDLHDGAVQRLYGAGLLAQSLRQHVSANTNAAKGLTRLINLINELITELRTLLSGSERQNERVDLSLALVPIIEEVRHTSKMVVHWNAPTIPFLPVECVNHLAAFLRECLSNVVRHADAQSAVVTLQNKNGWLSLTVRDDGKGLPADMEVGYGVRDIRDRARLLGGQVSFDSTANEGSMITLQIPLDHNS